MSKKESKEQYPLQNRVVSSGLVMLDLEIQVMVEKHKLQISMLKNEIEYLKKVIQIHDKGRKGETS